MGIDKGGACFCFWKFQGSDKKEVEFPTRGDQQSGITANYGIHTVITGIFLKCSGKWSNLLRSFSNQV